MSEKHTNIIISGFIILLFTISIFLMLNNDSIPIEANITYGLGLLVMVVTRKKKKNNKTSLS